MLLINLRRALALQQSKRFIVTTAITLKNNNSGPIDIYTESDLQDGEEYNQLVSKYFAYEKSHNCYIIHPYIKWGPKKKIDTNPKQQMQEAISLIDTLQSWKIHDHTIVPLETLDKPCLFGSGTLDNLKKYIHQNKDITAIFINKSTLPYAQLEELEYIFKLPIFDRYKIVMQILKLHAISKHAKLQVALAEIPYIRGKLKKHDTHFMAASDFDTKRLMLKNREQKLKIEIKKLRQHRELLRKKRKENDLPTVAVVGYTNAGKTALIKALTGDQNLQPRNQLFATLDVTIHAGVLPSYIEVLYIDTVGFISDIPTNLIECFVATLEDALFADIILHVNDLSNDNHLYQRKHVQSVLEMLAKKTNTDNLFEKVITIGTKSDLLESTKQCDILPISVKSNVGLSELKSLLDERILKLTNRCIVSTRIPIGGDEIRWLYQNATIVSIEEDEFNKQLQIVRIIILQPRLEQFKHYFLRKKIK